MFLKKVNVPCTFAKGKSYDVVSSNLVPVQITVMHTDLNRNHTTFTLESMQKASETIKNKPILAYISQNEDGKYDFGGHEIEVVFDDFDEENLLRARYLEYPIGVIPESTTIGYYVKDGKTYMSCTGYLYVDYSNEAIKLIEETDGKCVSMEIGIYDYEVLEDEVLNIKDFSFLGVTVLGDTKTPAMDENCTINFLDNKDSYSKFMDKMNEDIKKFELENNVEPTEPCNEEPTSETPVVDVVENDPVEPTEPPVVEPTEPIEPSVEPPKEELPKEEPTDEPPTEPTVEPSIDPVVVAESNKDHMNDGVSKVVVVEDGKDGKDGEESGILIVEHELKEFSELIGTKNKIGSYEELKALVLKKLSDYEVELEELRNYKVEKETVQRKADVQNILNEIDFCNDELNELVEKANKFELTLEEFRKEMYSIYGRAIAEKNKTKKKETAKKDEELNFSLYERNENKENKSSKDLYGGLFKDIL